MALDSSKISSEKRIKKNTKRLGRGNGSGKGNYCTRGIKGQRSRSGGKGGLKRLGFKLQLQKVPKLRGFKSMAKKPETISLAVLEKNIPDGSEVTVFLLKQKGLIRNVKNGVKIVATGDIKKKLNIKNCLATKKAAEAIEKVGGKLVF